MKHRITIICLIVIMFSVSCKTLFKGSPYQTYVDKLEKSGIQDTKMGRDWVNKGINILNNPNIATVLPFKEEIFFRKDLPMAMAYQIQYKKTEKLKISFKIKSEDNQRIFVDLFEGLQRRTNIHSTYSRDTTISYQNNQDQILLLRLQPQLLVNAFVEVQIVGQSKYAFPVKNGENKDIKSFWGASRDGGARKHEGVDIFNKKGTPIVAVEEGVITKVQTTNIGGKVVWQRLGVDGPSIYYAHLDEQLVKAGQYVKKGEILGLMGNTGNAKNTSPHLHFGIYDYGGAIDPLNYIKIRDVIPGDLKKEVRSLGESLLITKDNEATPVEILSVSTQNITYLDENDIINHQNKLTESTKKLSIKLNPSLPYILSKPHINSVPVAKFNPNDKYSVLAAKGNFYYVAQNYRQGWVASNAQFD